MDDVLQYVVVQFVLAHYRSVHFDTLYILVSYIHAVHCVHRTVPKFTCLTCSEHNLYVVTIFTDRFLASTKPYEYNMISPIRA